MKVPPTECTDNRPPESRKNVHIKEYGTVDRRVSRSFGSIIGFTFDVVEGTASEASLCDSEGGVR